MSNWISVNERLPDLHPDVWQDGDELVPFNVSDPVLCFYNGGEYVVAVFENDSGTAYTGWTSVADGANLRTVTHWMPLPAPPEEEHL